MAGLEAMKGLCEKTNRSFSYVGKTNNNPVHDMKTPTQSQTKRNGRVSRVYQLKPAKPAAMAGTSPEDRALAPVHAQADPLAPAKSLLRKLQPLHPTEFPAAAKGKSVLKVGLDIDVQHITA